jgi:hypothetical protein
MFKIKHKLMFTSGGGGGGGGATYRVELFPDVHMSRVNGFHGGGLNTFMHNGTPSYGSDLKDELIISLNKNFFTQDLPNNLHNAMVDLNAGHTWIFQKALVDPTDPDKYSYGVGKFTTTLTDESSIYYAQNAITLTDATTLMSATTTSPNVTWRG